MLARPSPLVEVGSGSSSYTMGGAQGVGIDVLVHDNGGCLGGHDCEGGSCARVWMGCGRDAQLFVELARMMVVVVMVYEVGRQAVSYARRDAAAVTWLRKS